MKIFKTERIINFNTKYLSKMESDNILSNSKENSYHPNFLTQKVNRFHIEKYNFHMGTNIKSGRWTLKEHIQYLQALEKYGTNWKKISNLIPSRTTNQIRSHSQKFYKKLKECKDAELGIDFTSKHINNVNDMIAHIKSINNDYNLVTVFLYLSEKCYPNRKHKKKDKMDVNIDINNILNEDRSVNNINNNSLFDNDINENIINKETNINMQFNNTNISNTNINNIIISNILINNKNLFNSSISLHNNPLNNIDIVSNYFINNDSKILLDKNWINNNSTNNFEFMDDNKIKDS